MHSYFKVSTDLGEFRVACSPLGITAIRPAAESQSAFEAAYRKRFGTRPLSGNIPDAYKKALRAALAGQQAPPAAIDWSGFTQFQRKVLKALQKVGI